jgi:hypothetical protein
MSMDEKERLVLGKEAAEVQVELAERDQEKESH